MSSTMLAMKAANESRLSEERRVLERDRNTMVLVLNHCIARGYAQTAQRLATEAGVQISKYAVADNMDLNSIVQEFECFYEMKFGRKPKLVRRVDGTDDGGGGNGLSKHAQARRRRAKMMGYDPGVEHGCASQVLKEMSKKAGGGGVVRESRSAGADRDGKKDDGEGEGEGGIGITGCAISRGGGTTSSSSSSSVDNNVHSADVFEHQLLKPIPTFGNDAELRSLAETITRDIYQENPDVSWSDVIELSEAKRLLKEAVVMPVMYPQLFTGLLSPWGGVLLYGPPGTGKTMLAKAVASQCRTTFFNISASSIVSKYRGDSEKLVRMLFELARYHAPSTIFIDEIDSIMGHRGGEGAGATEHEGSRRMKTELLIQMDGLAKSSALVFVLAASNIPWELDVALLRRLEKRVLVPLPGPAARAAMIRKYLSADRLPSGEVVDRLAPEVDVEDFAARTENFSGADIKLLCKECAMKPVRRLMARIESCSRAAALPRDGTAGAPTVAPEDVMRELLGDPVTSADLSEALEVVRPSGGDASHADKYVQWHRDFGST